MLCIRQFVLRARPLRQKRLSGLRDNPFERPFSQTHHTNKQSQVKNIRWRNNNHTYTISIDNGDFQDVYERCTKWTGSRFLSGEAEELACRSVEANLEALSVLAIKETGLGSWSIFPYDECTSSRRILLRGWASSSRNPDTPKELLAKLYHPVMGRPRLTAASEVATMDFARSVLKLPVPRVVFWSSDAGNTPVGAEFAVFEKSGGEGQLKSESWPKATAEQARSMANQCVSIENELFATRFEAYGSIYYRGDAPNRPNQPLTYINKHGEKKQNSRFTLGPPLLEGPYMVGSNVPDLPRSYPTYETYMLAHLDLIESRLENHSADDIVDYFGLVSLKGPGFRQRKNEDIWLACQVIRRILPSIIRFDSVEPMDLEPRLWPSSEGIEVDKSGTVTVWDWHTIDIQPVKLALHSITPSAEESLPWLHEHILSLHSPELARAYKAAPNNMAMQLSITTTALLYGCEAMAYQTLLSVNKAAVQEGREELLTEKERLHLEKCDQGVKRGMEAIMSVLNDPDIEIWPILEWTEGYNHAVYDKLVQAVELGKQRVIEKFAKDDAGLKAQIEANWPYKPTPRAFKDHVSESVLKECGYEV